MGADALMNFAYEFVPISYNNIDNPTTFLGVRITGFAIKRKDK
jgi:hypothetical protein